MITPNNGFNAVSAALSAATSRSVSLGVNPRRRPRQAARRAARHAAHPARRRTTDVAALAVHIMSNTALTGATYDIDGGQQLVS